MLGLRFSIFYELILHVIRGTGRVSSRPPLASKIFLYEPECRLNEGGEALAIDYPHLLDIVPPYLSDLSDVVDRPEERQPPHAILVAFGEPRVGERDLVYAGIPNAPANVAHPGAHPGEKTVFARLDAGLLPSFSKAAHDIGLACTGPPALWDLPEYGPSSFCAGHQLL
jgi:hypothetical protein